MKKYILIIGILQLILVSILQAISINDTNNIFANNLVRVDEIKYQQPDSILIAPIFIPDGVAKNSSLDRMKGLFYYMNVRLGFVDMPFHYVVFPDGKIYKTSNQSDEEHINLNDSNSSSVIVAYLANSKDRDFSDKAKESIRDITLDIANRNSINSENIDIKNLRVVLNLETKTSKLETREIAGGWLDTFLAVKKYVKANYSPIKKSYKIEVLDIKMPTNPVSPQDVVIIEIKLKNIGENTIYGNSDSALLLSKEDGKLSKFYINSIWSSRSQVALMSEEDILMPNKEATYQVKLKVPLFFGQQSENFVIKTANGDLIPGTDVVISLNVKNIEEPVVEILPTEIGYLNVRSADSGRSDIIGRVTPGERFIEKQRGINGYVQIQFSDDKLGWVSNKYVKRVN